MARDWLLITVSTPPGGTSTLRVYAWRNLRSLGGHYLQQSVCLLPATPKTTRAAARLVTRLRADGGHGEMLRIHLTDSKQETGVIDAIQRERTDEYHELVESTQQFHEELQHERRRGRTTYTELEESDADLARYQKWLAAIRARDYFEASAAVRPRWPSPRARRHSLSSKPKRYQQSSTSPCPRATADCTPSRGPTTESATGQQGVAS